MTNGHIDVIRRALAIFEKLVVGVAVNTEKGTLFPVEERVEMLCVVTRRWKNITVEPFDNLVVDFAKCKSASVILRGLRMLSDFEYEFQMALMNRRQNPRFEAVFLMPDEKYTYLSSSLVREVSRLGGSVKGLVPPLVEAALRRKNGHFKSS